MMASLPRALKASLCVAAFHGGFALGAWAGACWLQAPMPEVAALIEAVAALAVQAMLGAYAMGQSRGQIQGMRLMRRIIESEPFQVAGQC